VEHVNVMNYTSARIQIHTVRTAYTVHPLNLTRSFY